MWVMQLKPMYFFLVSVNARVNDDARCEWALVQYTMRFVVRIYSDIFVTICWYIFCWRILELFPNLDQILDIGFCLKIENQHLIDFFSIKNESSYLWRRCDWLFDCVLPSEEGCQERGGGEMWYCMRSFQKGRSVHKVQLSTSWVKARSHQATPSP